MAIDGKRESCSTVGDSRRPIPFLSFFTGAGLLDLGFIQQGFTAAWANECSEVFADAHDFAFSQRIGHGSCSITSRRSITDTSPRAILAEAFGQLGSPSTFGVIGGPPCPDFSVMGQHKGENGKNGHLSQVYVNRILALRPAFFVFENVAGLVRIARHRAFFDRLKAQLSEDYHVDWAVLNALDYGVPQDRRRLFLIGLRRSWACVQLHDSLHASIRAAEAGERKHWFPWPTPAYPNAVHAYAWPDEVPHYGAEPPAPKGLPEELMVGTHILSRGLELLPNGQDCFRPYSKRFLEVPEGQDCNKSFKRLHRWRYSPTVAYGNNEVHLHPTEPRRLTVREAMVLQSLPNEYELPDDMPLCHKFKTVGNGVPVKLARSVADSLGKVLRGASDDEDRV